MGNRTGTTVAGPQVEDMRSFLNTWVIPNDTRQETENLPDLAASPDDWARTLPHLPRPRADELADLLRLRDDLREDVDERGTRRLDAWLARRPQTVRIGEGELRLEGPAAPVDVVLRQAAGLVLTERWRRLRACPDCRWVFYDQSRNNTRTWCSMYAGESGRACGSIAKVKRMRETQKRRTAAVEAG
ncbi:MULTISPECIES: CGNR zinc finger domain-containing protein [unclassified Streptomyces]|uniref:CGNR zinc finger domain-containing protein n=1 Tax=unclassified Streptomyces TaxID=2593676 RepID=UPI0038252067